jgi:hypothetical protein
MITVWGTPKSAKHRLGYYVSKSNGSMDAKVAVRSLDANRMSEFESATQTVLDFVPILRAFEIAELSYHQLRATIEEVDNALRKIFAEPRGGVPLMHDSETLLQQRVMSFLFAARSFLDHTKTVLCHLFGTESAEVLKFTKHTNRLHGDNFSYRFLYKLRDMSQHVALPLSVFEIKFERSGSGELIYESNLKLDRDHLLLWKKWTGVTKDLQKQDAQFELMPFIDEKMKWLGKLCHGVFADHLDSIRHHFDYLTRQLDRLQIPPDAVPVLWVGESTVSALPQENVILPLEQTRRIMNICRTAW